MNKKFRFDDRLTHCPLCSSKSISLKYSIDHCTPSFTVYQCLQCNFIFMNPPLDKQSEHALYSKDYYNGTASYHYYDERTVEHYAAYVWNARLATIRKFIHSGNFLDVGCSFGGFLNIASKYFSVYGIELSSYSGNYAKQRFGKNRIHLGTLFDHNFNNNFFHVITLIEVIEHIRKPFEALVECYRLCADNGLVVIQTANMEGIQAKLQKQRYAYFLPGHFSYFSQDNLVKTLYTIGFKKIKIFQPVDFGVMPKLLKSRMNFSSFKDYTSWVRIILYHYASKIHYGNFALTSSMVVYAFK